MNVVETTLSGVKLIVPDIFTDARGYFLETFSLDRYEKALGTELEFVQDNLSFSGKGVLRGMHLQKEFPQAKLVRAVAGEVFDVILDVDPESPTFGNWHAEILNAENGHQIFIPKGYAHGFQVLSDTAVFEYKCIGYYQPSDESGVIWNDAEAGIDWPIKNPVVSGKDEQLPTLQELGSPAMTVLVLGATGQVGQSLAERLPQATFVTRDQADLNRPESLDQFVAELAPTFIVNAAAYTQVDRAEEEVAVAQRVNAEAPAVLAGLASRLEVPFLHLSTDYVFDGSNDRPYLETDAPNPINVYGRTKLAGEQAVLQQAPPFHWILRTSWVFSGYSSNFVKTVVRLAAEREVLTMVADQFGKPTFAGDIARVIAEIIDRCRRKVPLESGLYHLASARATTWYEFAQQIVRQAAGLGLIKEVPVKPITTAEFPTPAARPLYSVLDTEKLDRALQRPAPDWGPGLEQALQSLCDPSPG